MAACWVIAETGVIISSYTLTKATEQSGMLVAGSLLHILRASEARRALIYTLLRGTVTELADPGTKGKCKALCPNYSVSRWG